MASQPQTVLGDFAGRKFAGYGGRWFVRGVIVGLFLGLYIGWALYSP